MPRKAAFLDRDGTLVEDPGYPDDPARVALLPGAASGLRRLAGAGYALVVATNQSGIARGLYGEEDFRAVQARVEELLAERGVAIDATYHCPHHPDHTGPCDCRKPAGGMFERAARELGLDLASSIFVGDHPRDVAYAEEVGARAILIGGPDTVAPRGVEIARDLDEVARVVLGTRGPGAE